MLVTSIATLHSLTKQVFNLFVASCLALLFATSTYLVHSHYLTTDIPLMFFLVLSFYYSIQIILNRTDTIKPYLLTGIFIGLASATKYDGIVFWMMIPLAHIAKIIVNSKYLDSISFKDVMSKKLWVGLFAILIAFIFATPNAVLEYKKFWSDFSLYDTISPFFEEKGIFLYRLRRGALSDDVVSFSALQYLSGFLFFKFMVWANILFAVRLFGWMWVCNEEWDGYGKKGWKSWWWGGYDEERDSMKITEIEKKRICFYALIWIFFSFSSAILGDFFPIERSYLIETFGEVLRSRFIRPFYFLPFLTVGLFFYCGYLFKNKLLRKIINMILIVLVSIMFCVNNIKNFNEMKMFTLSTKIMFDKWAKFNLKPNTLIYQGPLMHLPRSNNFVAKNIKDIGMEYFGGRARN